MKMLFEIDDYKVEIKAFNTVMKDQSTDIATMNFVNLISLLAGEAQKSYREKDLGGLEKMAGRVSDQTFKALKKLGLYD